MHRRTLLVMAVLILLAVFAGTSLTYAYDQHQPEPLTGHAGAGTSCDGCHPAGSGSCAPCHFGDFTLAGKGPHGGYTASTNRCDSCHDIHASTGPLLLPGATVAASCGACHDGTGGNGVYGTIAARGLSAGASHRIDTTDSVPGGDASTGGSKTMAFGGIAGKLGCDDCHSPHDANTVAPFTHERRRAFSDYLNTFDNKTNRLLRKQPGSASTSAAVYGSGWCLACHAGRASGGTVHNHPVEPTSTVPAPFSYDNAAILVSDSATSVTVLGSLAYTNRGYLMPMPRTAQQGTHKPMCQQCHEDSRFVGVLTAAGNEGDAAPFAVRSSATTVSAPADNPRFQNFPHETVNARMTVETNDDLCTNCHPPTVLP